MESPAGNRAWKLENHGDGGGGVGGYRVDCLCRGAGIKPFTIRPMDTKGNSTTATQISPYFWFMCFSEFRWSNFFTSLLQ